MATKNNNNNSFNLCNYSTLFINNNKNNNSLNLCNCAALFINNNNNNNDHSFNLRNYTVEHFISWKN